MSYDLKFEYYIIAKLLKHLTKENSKSMKTRYKNLNSFYTACGYFIPGFTVAFYRRIYRIHVL